jgi:hypothetical protein
VFFCCTGSQLVEILDFWIHFTYRGVLVFDRWSVWEVLVCLRYVRGFNWRLSHIEDIQDVSKKDTLFTSRTHQQEKDKNEKQLPKRSPNKTHKKSLGHNYSSIFRPRIDAWIPDYQQSTQRIQRLLRTKHHLPPPRGTREKRLP